MATTHKLKEKQTQAPLPMTDQLNQILADTIDLKMKAKQAHWNSKGESFIALHELFDQVSRDTEEYADMIAERVAQLGAVAQGDLQAVSCRSRLSVYPEDIRACKDHVRALGGAIVAVADAHRQGIGAALAAHDPVTADILTEIARGLDKLHWYVASHLG